MATERTLDEAYKRHTVLDGVCVVWTSLADGDGENIIVKRVR